MDDDLKWFLGFIALFGIMLVVGWTSKSAKPPSTQTGTPAEARSAPTGQPEQQTVEQKIEQAQAEVLKLQSEVRQNVADANASPLRGQLTVGSVSWGPNEYITLYASASNKSPILISGITIRALSALNSVTIPNGWTMPNAGVIGEGDPIWLKPGQSASIITGKSPIGVSYQTNKCVGYLSNSISSSCPNPAYDALPPPPNALKNTCLNYLRAYSGCGIPKGPYPADVQNDGDCQAFMRDKYNYDTCASTHKNDSGFFSDWKIYLNRTGGTFWLADDVIELLDQNGKTITVYSY